MENRIITIPQTFLLFKIIPKENEKNDENMPRSIFAAISLFYATNNIELANKCIDCINSTLNILSQGPDGKTEIKIGIPCICWECGYVGIPEDNNNTNNNNTGDNTINSDELYKCNNCKSNLQTNLVEGIQPDGSKIPWIEKKMN